MKVREIMTSDPRTATPDTTLVEIATMMKDEDVGVIPIVEDDRVTGVVSDRDIVLRCIATGKDANDCTAEDVMSTGVKTIDADGEVDDAARIMADEQIRRLAVVKNGKLVGMLSLGDIAVNASESDAEEETTAETLEEVSRGVKGQGQPSSGRKDRNDRSERESRNAQRDRKQKKVAQGVSNRASRTKQSQNQKKVAAKAVPRRAEAGRRNTGGRRRAS